MISFDCVTQVEKLSLLLRDEELRREMGRAGRKTVEERYSLRLWGPRLAGLYRQLGEN